MPILNYTTSISVDKTVSEIQTMLIKAGASGILAEYDGGLIKALSFKLKVPSEDVSGVIREMSFRLPTDPAPVLEVLRIQKRRNSRIAANEDQARRVAWRIVKDWVEAQLAIIETQMVTTAQVFLPYSITKTGQSLYEHVASHPEMLLGDGHDDR